MIKPNTGKTESVFFAAGGTGGHVFPALAVAQAVKKIKPQWMVFFIGRLNSFEQKVVRENGFEMKFISAMGLKRNELLRNGLLPFIVVKSLIQCFLLVRKHRPKWIFGTGGYVSLAPLIIAGLMGIPVIIQEQNSFPGLANRIAAKWAKLVCLGHPDAASFLKVRVSAVLVHTGNPIREKGQYNTEKIRNAYHLSNNHETVLVLGGSQGARNLNQCVLAFLKRNASLSEKNWIWQTGTMDFDQISAETKNLVGIQCFEFINDVYPLYAIADWVVCRGGAMTLSEVLAFGCPALIVPLPTAAANHQWNNASTLVQAGAAEMTIEEENQFNQKMKFMMEQKEKRLAMGRKAKELGRPNAVAEITTQMESLGLV